MSAGRLVSSPALRGDDHARRGHTVHRRAGRRGQRQAGAERAVRGEGVGVGLSVGVLGDDGPGRGVVVVGDLATDAVGQRVRRRDAGLADREVEVDRRIEPGTGERELPAGSRELCLAGGERPDSPQRWWSGPRPRSPAGTGVIGSAAAVVSPAPISTPTATSPESQRRTMNCPFPRPTDAQSAGGRGAGAASTHRSSDDLVRRARGTPASR